LKKIRKLLLTINFVGVSIKNAPLWVSYALLCPDAAIITVKE
jgi:hypothetical protein